MIEPNEPTKLYEVLSFDPFRNFLFFVADCPLTDAKILAAAHLHRSAGRGTVWVQEHAAERGESRYSVGLLPSRELTTSERGAIADIASTVQVPYGEAEGLAPIFWDVPTHAQALRLAFDLCQLDWGMCLKAAIADVKDWEPKIDLRAILARDEEESK